MSMRTSSPNDFLAGDTSRAGIPTFDTGEALSLIDRHSFFEGTYRSSRDLRIEGEVKGTIECQGTLHIAEGAQVDAHVQAESITVAGELSGEIICRGRLQIMPSGRLHGKVTTQTLVINEGAVYEGQLEMIAPDTSKRIGSTGSAPRPLASIAGTPAAAQLAPAQQAPAQQAPAQHPTPDQSAPAPAPVRPAAVTAPVPSESNAPAAATPDASPRPAERRPRPDSGFAPADKNSSTFIRRLGGTEVPFGGRDEDSDDDD